MNQGLSEGAATREATKETQRRLIYPRLRHEIARLQSRVPVVPTRASYDRHISRVQARISTQRKVREHSLHPFAIAFFSLAVLLSAVSWTEARLGFTNPLRTIVFVSAAVVALLMGGAIFLHFRPFWDRYRAWLTAKASAASLKSRAEIVGFRTWKFDRYEVGVKRFWRAEKTLSYDLAQLKALGGSQVDIRAFNAVYAIGRALIDDITSTSNELINDAIRERIEAADSRGAERLIALLTPDGQQYYRRLLRDAIPNSVIESDSRASHPRESLRQPSSAPTAVRTTGPSKVQELTAHFAGESLVVSWRAPVHQALMVTSYTVCIEAPGFMTEMRIETTQTTVNVVIPNPLNVDYFVRVRAVTSTTKGPYAKPVGVRFSGSTASRASSRPSGDAPGRTQTLPNRSSEPSAPTELSIVPTEGGLLVTWNPPVRGTKDVLGYHVLVDNLGTGRIRSFKTSALRQIIPMDWIETSDECQVRVRAYTRTSFGECTERRPVHMVGPAPLRD